MLLSIVLTLGLVALCVFVHYEVLRWASITMPLMTVRPRKRIMVMIGLAMVAHIIEICLFAYAFYAMQNLMGLGAIIGPLEGDWLDFFYFSAASYTTLGMGDLLPTGPTRLVAAIESLAGLVLIGWTASFTYIAMRDFWDLH